MSNIYFCTILVSLTTSLMFVSCDEFDVSIFRSIDPRIVQTCYEKSLNLRTEIDDYWVNCINKKPNVIDLMMLLPALNKQICRKNELVDCIEHSREKFEVCLDKEQLGEFINDILGSVKAGFDYMCSNNERILEDFNNQRTSTCVSEMKPDLIQCQKNMPDDWMKKTMPDDFITITFRSQETCNKRGQWATCVVKTLDKCTDKLARKIFQGVFAAMLLGTPCKDDIYNSFPLLIPSEELEVKNYTKPPTATTDKTTTDKTTTAITQPVIDEKDKTNKPATPIPRPQQATDGNEKLPIVGLHVLIACLYVVTNVFHICWSGN